MISKNTLDLAYRRLVRQNSKLDPSQNRQSLRFAILSDAASQQFVPLLRTLFHENGANAEIYEGPFDAIEIEALNPASGLYAFKPDAIALANATQALRSRYYQSGASDFVGTTINRITHVWDALRENSTAQIIQFNFVLPYERQFGNYDVQMPESLYASVAELNRQLAREARERGTAVCDVEAISSYIGRAEWFDERLWNMSKTFCNLEYLPRVAQAIVDIVLAARGRVVKCVILDLDNTCWGGIVGDDGFQGIVICQHGDGESFFNFQHYLLSLKRRGILLAVCSKNDHNNALQPFVENPEMVLKQDDFAVFVANWKDKATNIREIQAVLQIGFDSMVFLDDNPFERNLVRELLPDVIVPELPEDPADYVRFLSELNLFETTSFSAEDMNRSTLYRQEAERRDFRSSISTVDEYLRSLDMRIQVGRFDRAKLPRIVQLIQRSNQFNLTTRRYTEADCERFMLDTQQFWPLHASLSDRFGDHGLISVVVLRKDRTNAELVILDWIMSCRVLGRGVEQYLMNQVVEIARTAGLLTITGEYIPTPKNALVKDFFAQFGFTKISDKDGVSKWSIDVLSYNPSSSYMKEFVSA